MSRYFLIFAFVIGAVSLPASANYAINGQCFANASEALDSFVSMYPRLVTVNSNSTAVYYWVSISSASISANNLTVVSRINTTNQAAIVLPVQNCTAPTVAPFDVTQALAAFSFFFSAVILMFVVSHGGGAVLEAIKKGGTRLLG